MGKNFYTSDIHFGHKNIIKYSKRPYKSIDDMTEGLIKRWNNKVGYEDTVYVLGDMFYGIKLDYEKIINRLNGKKILIKGNHDQWIENNEKLKKLFWDVADYKIIKDCGKQIVLFHYPIIEWAYKNNGALHLYGHVHDICNMETKIMYNMDNAYNVGADVNNLEPCTLEEIISNKKKFGYAIYEK